MDERVGESPTHRSEDFGARPSAGCRPRVRIIPAEDEVTTGTPAAEVEIDARLLGELLADQHPDLADLPAAQIDAGWDNVMFRLGDALVVRMPRRAIAAQLLVNEQDWLPVLSPRLPLATPAPIRCGTPGRGYPWRWSILPWLKGKPADEAPPGSDQAESLARFLRALHAPAPENAPANAVRGVPLAERAAPINERLARLRANTSLITAAVERAWRAGLEAPPAAESRWLHGDLHARNVLVHEGALSAIIDWGDITSGDVATDLASVWMLFDEAAARRRALERYEATESERARAKAWAVLFGAVLLDTGLVDNPRHAGMGARTLANVAADP
jgi:aminoglycoside phosphotransferase (APT) family kinase protein